MPSSRKALRFLNCDQLVQVTSPYSVQFGPRPCVMEIVAVSGRTSLAEPPELRKRGLALSGAGTMKSAVPLNSCWTRLR